MKLFDKARLAAFNPAERQQYEDSLKYYRDLKNVTDTAREEGREEGKLEAARQIAISLLPVLDDQGIAAATGLGLEELRELRRI